MGEESERGKRQRDEEEREGMRERKTDREKEDKGI